MDLLRSVQGMYGFRVQVDRPNGDLEPPTALDFVTLGVHAPQVLRLMTAAYPRAIDVHVTRIGGQE